MRHRVLFFLLIWLPVCADERTDFARDWKLFKELKIVDETQVGTETYRDFEFSLLEEFSDRQEFRYRIYRPFIDRYENCRPYSENKLVLSDGTEMSASYIPFKHHHESFHDFIATQAPHERNIPHFWQMIFENEVDQIVMVTELFEKRHPSRELAYPYWPQRTDRKIFIDSDFEIELVEESELLPELREKIEIKKLKLRYRGQERLVTHYWYRHWMDDTAPEQFETIFTLIKTVEVNKQSAKSKAPVLVHCSAGVGRTGVFVALYHLMQREKIEQAKTNLFEFVASLRWQRPYLVGMLSQYRFCYQAYHDEPTWNEMVR